MAQIGELLARIRSKQDLSLHDVEQATKIRIKYLQALEAEEYDQIPGQVYVIGFLRTYCRYLGLDAETIVNEYKQQEQNLEELTADEQPADIDMHQSGKSKKVYLGAIAGFILIGMLVLTTAMLLGNNGNSVPTPVVTPDEIDTPVIVDKQPSASPKDDQQSIDREQEQQDADNAKQETALPEEGIYGEIKVAEAKRCWVRISIDQKEVFSGTIIGPFLKTVSGKSDMHVVFGNAGAVSVTINGVDAGKIGQAGEVVHFDAQTEANGKLKLTINDQSRWVDPTGQTQ